MSDSLRDLGIRPTADRLLIEFVVESQSRGGIVLPEVAKERPMRGLVLAVGPGKDLGGGKLSTPCAAAGDYVLCGRYAGQPIDPDEKVEGSEFYIVRDDDIIAVLG